MNSSETDIQKGKMGDKIVESNKVIILEKTKSIFERTKITNLNTDCMEHVFKHLEFNDLLNISESSNQFYRAVCRVYKKKFHNINPVFNEEKYYKRLINQTIQYILYVQHLNLNLYFSRFFMDKEEETDVMEKNPQILITNPLILFKLLRNFGHLIRNLAINFAILNVNLCAKIENYLTEYCSDSLERFTLIIHLSKIPFKNLKKPFKKITGIKIYTARDQTGYYIQFVNENNLPNIQHIFLYNRDCLQDSENIHYENIEYFTLCSQTRMEKIPFSFGNLKHLIICGYPIINDEICKFIGNIEHLTTLKLYLDRYESSNSFRKLLELKNIQTNVVEMECEFHQNFLVDDIYYFLKQSKKLRKFSVHQCKFSLSEYLDYYSIVLKTIPIKLGIEWKFISIDPYRNPFKTQFKYKGFVIEKITD